MNRIVIASLALIASFSAAQAHEYPWGTNTSDIDARRAAETRRIEDGRRSGALSAREYDYLKREQARIAAHERQAKADGYVSPEERRRLNHELDHASDHIRQLKHNGEVAGWRRGYGWW